jgi:hypothetical protein
MAMSNYMHFVDTFGYWLNVPPVMRGRTMREALPDVYLAAVRRQQDHPPTALSVEQARNYLDSQLPGATKALHEAYVSHYEKVGRLAHEWRPSLASLRQQLQAR